MQILNRRFYDIVIPSVMEQRKFNFKCLSLCDLIKRIIESDEPDKKLAKMLYKKLINVH